MTGMRLPWRLLADARVALRFAARELRGGLSGFRVFIGCIALGVAAIAAVGSVAHGMRDTIAVEGRLILGADISFSLVQRRGTEAERAWLAGLGQMSEVATLRAMARREDAPAVTGEAPPALPGQALVEVKAIDAAYPLYGDVSVSGTGAWRDRLARQADGSFGAVMEPALTARLGVKVGDRIALGLGRLTLTGILAGEPDKIGGGIGFGPRLLLSAEALESTSLVQPGSLVRWTYRIKLPAEGADRAHLEALKTDAGKLFPEAGWEIRTRFDASPGLSRNIDNFAAFLTLVGLTALMVGGVGVANAVQAFVTSKRDVIAVMKSLGATGDMVFLIYGLQVAAVTLAGVVVGCIGGIGLTALAAHLLAQHLPLAQGGTIYWADLALAGLYGFLTAAAFALWPLGRTHDLSPAALFRDGVERAAGRPRRRYLVMIGSVAVLLAGLTLAEAPDARVGAGYLAAMVLIFALLRGLSWLIGWGARRLPNGGSAQWRLALANLHRPGAATTSVMLSLGLGLTLIVALGLVETNLSGQLGAQLPKSVPSFFFLDVTARDIDGFADLVGKVAPDATFERVPMLRGRIVAIAGVPAEAVKVPPRAAFILQGDRGVTFEATLPKNSTLVGGSWWPAGYDGPPLVSLEAELAQDLGLKLGDALTVNVLGRNITAEVASLRKVVWSSFGINFFMVFSPNTFNGAPVGYLSTVAFPAGAPEPAEMQLLAKITSTYPTITSIRVKDQIQAVNDLIGQLATGVAAAASVAILSAILVLAGAFAAGQERRIYDAVILKTVGATRVQILTALTLEFVLLGLASAAFAVAAGSLIAWGAMVRGMDLEFHVSLSIALLAIVVALIATLILGLSGTWVALSLKAAPVLRNR